MNTLAISEARNNLPKLVNKVYKNMERIVITVNGKAKAVVLSPEELESLEETAEILAIPGSKQAIRKGINQLRKGLSTYVDEL